MIVSQECIETTLDGVIAKYLDGEKYLKKEDFMHACQDLGIGAPNGLVKPFILMAIFQKAKDIQATCLTLPQARTAILEAIDIAGIRLEEVLSSGKSIKASTNSHDSGRGRSRSPIKAPDAQQRAKSASFESASAITRGRTVNTAGASLGRVSVKSPHDVALSPRDAASARAFSPSRVTMAKDSDNHVARSAKSANSLPPIVSIFLPQGGSAPGEETNQMSKSAAIPEWRIDQSAQLTSRYREEWAAQNKKRHEGLSHEESNAVLMPNFQDLANHYTKAETDKYAKLTVIRPETVSKAEDPPRSSPLFRLSSPERRHIHSHPDASSSGFHHNSVQPAIFRLGFPAGADFRQSSELHQQSNKPVRGTDFPSPDNSLDDVMAEYFAIELQGGIKNQDPNRRLSKEKFIHLCQKLGVGAPEGPIEHVVLMAVFQKAKDFQATDLTLPQARTAILEAVDIAGIGLDEGILSSPSPRETIPDSEMGLEVKENKRLRRILDHLANQRAEREFKKDSRDMFRAMHGMSAHVKVIEMDEEDQAIRIETIDSSQVQVESTLGIQRESAAQARQDLVNALASNTTLISNVQAMSKRYEESESAALSEITADFALLQKDSDTDAALANQFQHMTALDTRLLLTTEAQTQSTEKLNDLRILMGKMFQDVKMEQADNLNSLSSKLELQKNLQIEVTAAAAAAEAAEKLRAEEEAAAKLQAEQEAAAEAAAKLRAEQEAAAKLRAEQEAAAAAAEAAKAAAKLRAEEEAAAKLRAEQEAAAAAAEKAAAMIRAEEAAAKIRDEQEAAAKLQIEEKAAAAKAVDEIQTEEEATSKLCTLGDEIPNVSAVGVPSNIFAQEETAVKMHAEEAATLKADAALQIQAEDEAAAEIRAEGEAAATENAEARLQAKEEAAATLRAEEEAATEITVENAVARLQAEDEEAAKLQVEAAKAVDVAARPQTEAETADLGAHEEALGGTTHLLEDSVVAEEQVVATTDLQEQSEEANSQTAVATTITLEESVETVSGLAVASEVVVGEVKGADAALVSDQVPAEDERVMEATKMNAGAAVGEIIHPPPSEESLPTTSASQPEEVERVEPEKHEATTEEAEVASLVKALERADTVAKLRSEEGVASVIKDRADMDVPVKTSPQAGGADALVDVPAELQWLLGDLPPTSYNVAQARLVNQAYHTMHTWLAVCWMAIKPLYRIIFYIRTSSS